MRRGLPGEEGSEGVRVGMARAKGLVMRTQEAGEDSSFCGGGAGADIGSQAREASQRNAVWLQVGNRWERGRRMWRGEGVRR